MDRIATVFGGSGFVGRHVVQRMARRGWRVRVACRNPQEALFVRTHGVVGQVEPVFANIRDDRSARGAVAGADSVVNCVGVLRESGGNTFAAVQSGGAGRVARLAKEAGASRFVHISAIGADPNGDTPYSRTKALGEAAVLEEFPDAVILRPSIVFGPEDEFFNRFASMSTLGPVLPIVGADTRFQPVYVGDVAEAAAMAASGEADSGVYELGGPDIRTFRELMETMLEVIGRRRLVIDLPEWIARTIAAVAGFGEAVSLGLLPAPITGDQITQLRRDNIVGGGVKTFSDLGIEPRSPKAILPEYLWRYRPSGQYDAIKASARNLRP